MSASGNGVEEGNPIPTLTITVQPDRNGVIVHGPIKNKELCWRMLTDAATVILNYQDPSQIIVPSIVPPRDILKPQ